MLDDKVKKQTTVAVITTVYNDLEGLSKTAESVLSQDFPIKWIVVDADSGDDHRTFLNNIEPKIHEFNWISEKDEGLYHGMNKGYLMGLADIYLFLNANDTLASSSTIRQVVDSYLSEKWQWAVGLAVRFDEDETPVAVWEYLNPELGGLALGTRTFCHQATFYTKDLLERTMPYDQTNLAADHLLNIKAFSISHPKMLPLVTTFFANGGVSGKRSTSAAFRDLRRIRTDLNLYFLKNRYVDFLITKFIVLLLNAGGAIWNINRKLSRKLVKEKKRVYPQVD
jgi:glycosyltransferase involved in cell wall biosynthesis